MTKKSLAHETLFRKFPTRQSVKTLYQNLGGKWYAFADVNGEAYFAPLDFIKTESSRVISFKEEDALEQNEPCTKTKDA